MSLFTQREIHAWEGNVNIPCAPQYDEYVADGDIVMCPPDNIGYDLKSLEVDSTSASSVLQVTGKYHGFNQRLVGVCYAANSKFALDGFTGDASPALMTAAITGVTTPWNLCPYAWKPCDKLIVGPAAIDERTGVPLYPRGKANAGNTTLWPAHPMLWTGNPENYPVVDIFLKRFGGVQILKKETPFTLLPLYFVAATNVLDRNSNHAVLRDILPLMHLYDGEEQNMPMEERLGKGDAWARTFLKPEWDNHISKMSPVEIIEAYLMTVRCQMELYSLVRTQPNSRGRAILRF